MPRVPRLVSELYRRSFWQVLAIYLLGHGSATRSFKA